MLGGNGKALAARGMRDVFILDQRGLLNDLTRVAQKLRALLREQNAPAVAQKDGDARFLLQLAHGGGEAGLGDKQRLCGLGDGAALGDLDDVFQLLKRHKKTFPWGSAPNLAKNPRFLENGERIAFCLQSERPPRGSCHAEGMTEGVRPSRFYHTRSPFSIHIIALSYGQSYNIHVCLYGAFRI